MERKESSRQLAAILFTDIVGYTSMMQRDELEAVASVQKLHTVLEKTVPVHEGEIYQYYGDGSLSIFNSATQAVDCAFEIQKQLLQEPALLARTGIHIGEIYTKNRKIFGDGVNIASRIESIGQGGTVLFSRDVYEKVRNHTSLIIRSIGTFEFKDVDDPVEIFALWNPEIIQPDISTIEGKLKHPLKRSKWLMRILLVAGALTMLAGLGFFLRAHPGIEKPYAWETKKSIAVLPFKNLSEGNEGDYLSSGITEDILTQLAQINDLKVISRSSSMKYKNSDKSLLIIAQELGVTSLLEGSVQKDGENLRVSVQLIKASDASVIWAERFDSKFEDVLNMQCDIALAVSEKLQVPIKRRVKNRLNDKVNIDSLAYVNYQKGQELLLRSSGTNEDLVQAIQYFEMSIKEDSSFSKAWVGLAEAHLETIFWNRAPNEETLPKAQNAALKALELDSRLGECYEVLGAVDLLQKDLRSAEKYFRKAIKLNPSYVFSYERLAWVSIFTGHTDEGIDLFHRAMQLDPLSTRIRGSYAISFYFLRRFDEGISIVNENLRQFPNDNFLMWTLGYLQAGKGDYQEALENLNKRTIGTSSNWVLAYSYAKTGNMAMADTILQNNIEKSKTEYIPDFMMAAMYHAVGNEIEALQCLEKSIETGAEGYFILGLESDPMFRDLWDHPEFQKVVASVKNEYNL